MTLVETKWSRENINVKHPETVKSQFANFMESFLNAESGLKHAKLCKQKSICLKLTFFEF